mgnify:CR=1 FL=1
MEMVQSSDKLGGRGQSDFASFFDGELSKIGSLSCPVKFVGVHDVFLRRPEHLRPPRF